MHFWFLVYINTVNEYVCGCVVHWCVYMCMTDHLFWKILLPQKGAVVSTINYNLKDQTTLLRREKSAKYKQAVKWKTTSVFICFSQRWPHLVILTENDFEWLSRVKKDRLTCHLFPRGGLQCKNVEMWTSRDSTYTHWLLPILHHILFLKGL